MTESKISKRQIGSMMFLYYIAKNVVSKLAEDNKVDDEKVDTMIANHVITECAKVAPQKGDE